MTTYDPLRDSTDTLKTAAVATLTTAGYSWNRSTTSFSAYLATALTGIGGSSVSNRTMSTNQLLAALVNALGGSVSHLRTSRNGLLAALGTASNPGGYTPRPVRFDGAIGLQNSALAFVPNGAIWSASMVVAFDDVATYGSTLFASDPFVQYIVYGGTAPPPNTFQTGTGNLEDYEYQNLVDDIVSTFAQRQYYSLIFTATAGPSNTTLVKVLIDGVEKSFSIQSSSDTTVSEILIDGLLFLIGVDGFGGNNLVGCMADFWFGNTSLRDGDNNWDQTLVEKFFKDGLPQDPSGFPSGAVLLSADDTGPESFAVNQYPGGSFVLTSPVPFNTVTISRDGTFFVASSHNEPHYAYTSSDGLTWTKQIGSGLHQFFKFACSADGQHIVGVEYQGDAQVLISHDWGVTWDQVTGLASPSLGWQAAAMSDDGQTIYIGADTGPLGYLYRSTNGGGSWLDITSNLNDISIVRELCCSADGTKVGLSQHSAHYAHSTNSGDTFTLVTDAFLTGGIQVYLCMSADGDHLAAAVYQGTSTLFTSSNGGAAWASRPAITFPNSANSNQALACDSSGQKILVKCETGLLYSADGGATADVVDESTDFTGVSISGDGSTLCAVSTQGNGKEWLSINGGASFALATITTTNLTYAGYPSY